MKNKLKRWLLFLLPTHDFFILSIIAIILFASVITIFSSIRAYHLHAAAVESKLSEDGERVAQAFAVSMHYATQMTTLVGEKTLAAGPSNLQAVREVLGDRYLTSKNTSDFFSWTFFDYTNPANFLVVSTLHGVLAEPIDMSVRDYVQRAPKEPWVLHFDPPSIGKTSKQWVIPAGMGIADSHGVYRGLISMGFNIAQIGERLEKTLAHKGTHFALLNDQGQVIFASGVKAGPLLDMEQELHTQLPSLSTLSGEHGALPNTVGSKEKPYSYYHKIPDLPFFLLVGYDPALFSAELHDSLMLGTPQILMIGVFALALIFLLRHFVVKPVMELSDAADRISRDEHIHKIPRSKTYETNNLAKQLLKVKRFVTREKIMRAKLAHVVEVARESDKAREKFMYDMHRALAVPLSALKGISNLLRKEELGPLSQQNYGHIFDVIEEATKQLETYTTDAIFPSEFSLPKLVRHCIKVHQKQAVHSQVRIVEEIEPDLPLLWADYLRVQQVILSALYHSLQLVTKGCEVQVRVFEELPESKSTPHFCVIQIEDNGAGATEEQRAELFKFREFVEHKRISKIFVRDPDMTRLDFPVIRHLLSLHRGSFTLESMPQKGSLFTIKIPYLTRDELPPFGIDETPAPKAQKKKPRKRAGKTQQESNVIPFPRGGVR